MLKKVERSGHEQVACKSDVKEYRASLLKESKFPEQQIEVIFPKKGKVLVYKLKCGEDKAEHIVVDKDLHFIGTHKYCIPALKTVHTYPDMYPRFTADEGALKFLLKGANLMAPGLINNQASMDEVDDGSIVSVYVHGYEHCIVLIVRSRHWA
jgi:PUA domain protein